jgi:hypothetical protein
MTRARLHSGLPLLALVLVWAAAAERGIAQRPPAGSPGAAFGGIRTNTPAIGGAVVDAVTDLPIAGATVSLGPGSVNEGSQLTDQLGRFLFSNLAPRTSYELHATKPGYYSGSFGKDTWNGALRRIELVDRQWVADARIPLFRPGAMSGRVLDAAGVPMAGIRVAAVELFRGMGDPRLAAGPTSRTDGQGRYRLAPLSTGEYLVVVPSVQMSLPSSMPAAARVAVVTDSLAGPARRVALPRDVLVVGAMHLLVDPAQPPPLAPRADGQSQAYPTAAYPDATSLSGARVIPLGVSEERSGIDVTLRPAPTFTVTGTLDGPATAARDLPVRLLPRGRESMGLGFETALTVADQNGRFSFLNVPDGDYTIAAGRIVAGYGLRPPGALDDSVTLPGPVSMSRVSAAPGPGVVIMAQTGGSRHFGRLGLKVAGHDVANLVVPLQRGATIRGRIDVAPARERVGSSVPGYISISDGPSTSSGRSETAAEPLASTTLSATIPRIRVIAEPANGDVSMAVPEVPATREFTIDGLLPGEYLLRLSSSALESIRWQGRDYTETPLSVTSGADVTGIVVTVASALSVQSATVRDEKGRDALDATVLCFPVDPARWQRQGFRPLGLRAIPVGRAGSYFLPAVPHGEYYLVAVPGQLPESWRDPAFLARAAKAAIRVTLDGTRRTPDLLLTALP